MIVLVCALGFAYSAPNLLGEGGRAWVKSALPSWMPHQTVNLGLDLQGGSHILLEVDLSSVMKERTQDLVSSVRPDLRKEKIGYKRIGAISGGMRLTLRNVSDADKAKKIIRGVDRSLEILSSEGGIIEANFSEAAIKDIQDQTIAQSIEIVRRRVDETGTNEPIIQRQGDNRIVVQLPGLDDPQRVKDLLGKTAKLSFHLVNMEAGAKLRSGGGTLVLPMQEAPTQTMELQRRSIITGDMLVNAQFSPDQNGQPAVSFRFNAVGAKRFCDLSRANVNRLFAIVLDNEIISAPVIREAICGGSGQISGSFSVKEASDLALLLRAGALPAPLKILEERTVGPSLGADSVEAGKMAALIGLLFVLIYMSVNYSLFGVFASAAMIANLALIFAILSGLQATLTLPGIAGIVLTVGMSVDANVLIFERIREELRGGRSALSAVDSGFSKALATIIDSNLTTLIASVILYSFGTGPIKGFAVTLGIGILTSFFAAIMVTRLMVVVWLRNRKPSDLPV